jgi:hypothetical protein
MSADMGMAKVTSFRNFVLDYSKVRLIRSYFAQRKRKNAVFIWIPKTAGTSIRNMLHAVTYLNTHDVKYRFPHRGIVTFGHMDYLGLVDQGYISSYFNESSYKFAITRNPYDRAVSLYFYIVKSQQKSCGPSFLEFFSRIAEDGVPPIGLYNKNALSQCNPQLRWVENVNFNYLGAMETLHDDIEIICRDLEISNASLHKFNSTQHDDYKKYYCPESKKIVEELYHEDFEAFRYPLEEWPELNENKGTSRNEVGSGEF